MFIQSKLGSHMHILSQERDNDMKLIQRFAKLGRIALSEDYL